jgi:protein subunit release factor A
MTLWKEDEIEISFFKSSGPGGQHKNTTLSAVRVRHLPTGIVVVATDSRSQHRNKERALEELERRLRKRMERKKPRVATRASKASKERRLIAKKLRGERLRVRRAKDVD